MLSRILVPLDGSPESKEALPVAQMVARETGGSLMLLRVVPWPDAAEDAEATAEAWTQMKRTTTELAGRGVHAVPALRHGDAADEILEQCRAQHSDLIVMRTHARAGLERAVLGSVTARVLHTTGVPVMLVRGGGRPISHLRTLLVPVDSSPGGAAGLGVAVQLARSTAAEVKLLQVSVPLSMQVHAAYDYGGLMHFDPDWDEEASGAARVYVDGLAKHLQGVGVRADGQVLMAPDVAAAIVEVADGSSADVIVMSTHALTGPARALLGSVADAVVRTAHCPVLLVHRTAPAEEMGSQNRLTSAPETNVQTTHVSAGGATMVEFTPKVPGTYVIVDHSLGRMEKGATGQVVVDGDANPDVFQPLVTGSGGSGGH